MKMTKHPIIRPTLRGLVLALAATALSSYVAQATPYASQVTKSGNTVSFVLNQNAQGLVVLRNGANPVSPGTTAGVLSFDMTGYTSYQIIVTGNTTVGWTQLAADGTDRNFEYPFGVAINKNPSSTNFGRVYVSNARVGTTGLGRACSDGIYVLRADGAAVTFATGGKTWTGNSAPFKSIVGPDNHLYVADFSNDLAYEFNDDMSAVTALIDASNKTGTGTTAQYVNSIYVEGTQAAGNRSIYLVNGDYTDTTRKGMIRYDLLGNAAATPSDTGTQIIGPTAWHGYYPYDVTRDSAGDWYLTTYRGNPNNAPAITKFNGAGVLPLDDDILWEVADWTTYYYAYCLDVNNVAGQVAYGNNLNGNVHFFDAANGSFKQTLAAGSSIRDLAFDIVGNMVTVDNAAEWARFWSPGGYTVANTKSDGTFILTKPSIDVSVTATTDTTSMDLNQPPGVFQLTRTGDTGLGLPVGYTLTGTAVNGTHYQPLSGTVNFPAGDSSANINVTAIPFSPAGPTRSVILTLNSSNTYSPVTPVSATVWIVDTNKPTIQIAARSTQFYERTNDYARFRLTRWGDTNVYLGQINVTYAGTANEGTQYYGTASTNMSYGDVTMDVFAFPIHDGVVTGPLTVTATVAAAPVFDPSYVVGTPATSAAVTRVDSDDLPETVLFADNFDTDSSANWTLRFAARNGIDDYTTSWAYDYSGVFIPPAPHSQSASTLGLQMAVNKVDGTAGGGAGLNLYPNGQSFSGNYALRFDMFLMVGGTSATTEYALCGINHSGNQTNWFRGPSTANTPNDGVGSTWSYDGLWVSIEADASGTDDYMFLSAPASNPGGIWGPTTYATVGATPFTGVFKSPPFFTGGVGGGSPANSPGYNTPIWADVELSQIGNVVTLKIDHSVILSYTNTAAAQSGNIMIGYDDAYDSILAGSGVIIDNLRVISLAVPVITKIVQNGGNLEITFSANSGDVPAQFVLQQSTPLATGPYADTTSTITSLGGGAFKAVKAVGASPTFYRIKRIY
jgi:hypothetical protein